MTATAVEFKAEEITDEKFMSTIRELVKEKPEYVYSPPLHQQTFPGDPSCFYVHTHEETGESETPGCLIGAALYKLGVPLDELRNQETNNATTVLTALHIPLSYDARSTALVLQKVQDDGRSWGEAYVRATGESI